MFGQMLGSNSRIKNGRSSCVRLIMHSMTQAPAGGHSKLHELCQLKHFTLAWMILLQWMYNLGARKFPLFSTEVSGCTPVARSKNNGSCIELYNYASSLLNTKLNLSVDMFHKEMAGSHFVFVNLFEIMSEVMNDAASYGIEVIDEHCCKTIAGGSRCLVDGSVCSNRSNHLFFDGGHPADVTNSIMGRMAYSANLTVGFIKILVLVSFFFSEAAGNITAMFIFGDSVVDNGNNVYLPDSEATANFLPYGIDLAAPTGRFTNKWTVADVLGQLLGLPHPLPGFNDPTTKGTKILSGVNYASAGSGILDSTTFNITVIPMNQQITNFEKGTLPELRSNLSSYLSGSIFVFNTGGNDYSDHCFQETRCYLPEFTWLLIGNFTLQLKWMYGLGARKFVLFGCQPSGCTPGARLRNGGNCSEDFNLAAILFNTCLNASIDRLTSEMPGSHFVFANTYEVLSEIIADPASYGFDVIDKPCCAVSAASQGSLCQRNGSACADRNTYLYFDGSHPSNAANWILASTIYSSDVQSYAYPFNVKQLSNLNADFTHPGLISDLAMDVIEMEVQ
ncbi:GDSL esterase/lipase [Nymphaea thermarum]|nr:GDSL esterase/lipase [Nymphaea thermarum]